MSVSHLTRAHPRRAGQAVDSFTALRGPRSRQQLEAAEQTRWLSWFGLPALLAAVLVALVFATGETWIIGVAVVAVILDIVVLIWLALSSDTNGLAASDTARPH